MDVILSAVRVNHPSSYVPLTIGHDFVRIDYEGAKAVQSPNPRVGVPELAELIQPEYEAITARARRLTEIARQHQDMLRRSPCRSRCGD